MQAVVSDIPMMVPMQWLIVMASVCASSMMSFITSVSTKALLTKARVVWSETRDCGR